MKKGLIIVLGVLFALALIGMYIFGIYNKFVVANETVENQWAQVETQYQRRYDLIPNLVESVKGMMQQEQEIFQSLAEARTRYGNASSVEERVEATNQVESALGRLLVVMENYPELKSAENVQTLMAQLEGTENRISVERKRFNDGVAQFNMMIKQFPGKFFASIFGFEEKAYFQSAAGAEEAPKVEF